ncbi:MAG: type I secretion protein TolC [Rhodothalassiaceae bacterium]|nr:MAG: type I secretion protein TolC [Rhodothalassiaceae bacterium]
MKKAIAGAVVAAFGLAASGVMGQPARAETLKEALSAAYQTNPDLLAARAQQRALDETVSRATSRWRPNLSGQVQIFETDSNNRTLRQRDQSVVSDLDVKGRNEIYSLRADQNIFRGFRNFNELKGARANVFAGRADLLNTEQQVLLDAVTAYVDVLRDQAVLKLNDNNVTVLQRQLDATRDRFEVGEVTRTDVAQAEARLAGAKAQRAQAAAALEASRATYRRVIGHFPETLEEAPALPPLPASEDEAMAIALEENPLIIAARYRELAARYDIKVAKGAMLPSVDAFASYQRSESPSVTFDPLILDFGPARNIRKAKTYGVTVTIPLYQSGAEYSDIRRSKQVRSQRLLQIVGAERLVSQNVRTAWENFRAAEAQIASTEAQVRANEIALEGVKQEALVGSRTTLDVLNAEQELLDARVNLVRARRDHYVAGFSLLSAIGRLNAKALDLPVELYDPEEYYRDVKWQFIGWGDGPSAREELEKARSGGVQLAEGERAGR